MNRLVLKSLLVFSVVVATSFAVAQTTDPLPRRPDLGASLAPTAQGTTPQGVIVYNPRADGTFAVAGLKAGDILVEYDGKSVTTPALIVGLLSAQKTGDKFKVAYYRDGKRATVEVTLKEKPRVKGTNFEMLYHSVLSNGKRMRTLVTKPNKPGKHPVLFFIGGLGNYSMDSPWGTGAYKEFIVDFAERDWVTVRVDKPGQGDSEGGPTSETDYNTELDIYRQALKATKEYDFVDANRIYVFGHSMGGCFGPQVVSETPVKGLAIYGGVYKTWLEYWLENVRRQNTLAGVSDADNDKAMKNLALADALILLGDQSPEDVKKQFPSTADYINGSYPDGKSFGGRILAFWRQIAHTNFPDYWKKVDSNVLMMWGENEWISTRADHEMAADFINQKSPGKGKFALIKNSDHGFFQTTSTKDSYSRWGRGGTFNPEALNTFKAWIEECEKKP